MTTKTKAREIVEIEIFLDDAVTLDEHGQLPFRYRTLSGADAGKKLHGRDVKEGGFVMWDVPAGVQYKAVNREGALAIALVRKAELVARREAEHAALRSEWAAGAEKLLVVGMQIFGDDDRISNPMTKPSEELIARAGGWAPAYSLATEFLRPYGVAVHGYLPPRKPGEAYYAGMPLTKDILDAIFSKKLAAKKEAEQKQEAGLAEIREFRAEGGHVVALNVCWECGSNRILGEYDDSGRVVRMDRAVYSMAAEALGKGASLRFTFKVLRSEYCGC